MNELSTNKPEDDKLRTLKLYTAGVYLCQALTFMLAGLPLLIGVVINFIKKNEVEGTWLESHFDWQIKTVWVTLAGFAVSGLTFGMGIGFFVLIVTVVLLVYRITIGWFALNENKSMKNIE